jgi:hypothetical protein
VLSTTVLNALLTALDDRQEQHRSPDEGSCRERAAPRKRRVGYDSCAYRLGSENQVLLLSRAGPHVAAQLLRIRMKRPQEEVSVDSPR